MFQHVSGTGASWHVVWVYRFSSRTLLFTCCLPPSVSQPSIRLAQELSSMPSKHPTSPKNDAVELLLFTVQDHETYGSSREQDLSFTSGTSGTARTGLGPCRLSSSVASCMLTLHLSRRGWWLGPAVGAAEVWAYNAAVEAQRFHSHWPSSGMHNSC